MKSVVWSPHILLDYSSLQYTSILLYSVSLFLAAGLSLLIPVIIKKTERNQGTGFIRRFKYALKNNPSLLYLSVIISIPAFFSSLSAIGITYLFAGSSREWYSISYSLYYVGPIISGIIFGKHFPYRGVVGTILTILIISGLLFIVITFLLKTPLLTSLMFLVVGLSFSSYVVLYSTYLQHVTDKEMLGRTPLSFYIFRGISHSSGCHSHSIFHCQFGC